MALLLTFVTWKVSFVPLGLMNVTVVMLIASLKASLVALFLRHLRYENKLVWAFALFRWDSYRSLSLDAGGCAYQVKRQFDVNRFV